jgi:hypothetical protein
MGLANIFSGQASPAPLADIVGLQPTDFEQLATIAWQWLVLSALIAWIGALIANYRLLSAFRGHQQSEIAAILHIAARRQRRQSWLWLSIILTGCTALFWLRLPHVLPQQLGQVPRWPALASFVTSTPEGRLWLARGGLALLALGLAAVSLLAHQRARHLREPDLLARSARGRSRWHRRRSNQYGTEPAEGTSLEQRFLAERRHAQRSLVVVATLLCTFLFPLANGPGAQLPITALALNGVVLLALAMWLGGVLYLASILVPASYIIESAERTQTLVEALSASRPSVTPVLFAVALYGVFSVETRLSSSSSLPLLFNTPFGWLLVAEFTLLGVTLLLTLYQVRRALPALAQAAWLAARGTVMSVLEGMDVSRSLELSQYERQKLANQAERRMTYIAYMQVIVGMLVLLCLVLATVLAGQPAI